MTKVKDTKGSDSDKIPAEPEVMKLWRRLIADRDDLVAQIPSWESPDHPIKQYHDRVAAKHGSHGLTEWRQRDNDGQARRRATQLRERLGRIDRAIKIGTRDEAPNDRGITLGQLRALVDSERDAAENAAREALEAGWADRKNRNERHVAQLRRWRFVTGQNSTPSDFNALPDLGALYKEDRDYVNAARRNARRSGGRGAATGGGTKESCGRVLRHLLGTGVW